MGMAHHVDAFQGGREAAQAAKQLLNSGSIHLAIAVGPGDVHFQDFIEGTRLVIGEESLVGFPSTQVVTNNSTSSDVSAVFLYHSSESKVSIASHLKNGHSDMAAISSVLTQLKSKRGNDPQSYENRYLILLENFNSEEAISTARKGRFEAGLFTQVIAINSALLTHTPLISQDRHIQPGLVAIEFLTQETWGIASINLSEFKNHKGIYAEAAKTIIRKALAQTKSKPAIGIVFSNCAKDVVDSKDWESIFQVGETLIPGMPMVGMNTADIYIHLNDQPHLSNKDSMSILLFT